MSADDLKNTLERTAEVLQRALRCGKVGDRELDPLLQTPTWRGDLYQAITRAALETPADASADHSTTDIATDDPTASWTPGQLLVQYCLHRQDRAAVPADILRIYEAFGLELLADRQLCGRSAGNSLLASLEATGIAAASIRRLSAFHELLRLLGAASEQGRRTILLRVVGDVDGIVAVVAEMTAAASAPGIRWLACLRELLDQHAAATRVDPGLATTHEPLDWLFDLPLLRRIANAATRASQRGGDDADADTLVHSQRRLAADATEILGKLAAGDSLAEELWWRSFDVNGWSAPAVATLCLGRERATWLTSGPHDPDRPRIQSAHVGSASNHAASVVVFGAGVAGLTAAHELAERGLAVTVVDAAMPHDRMPGMQANVGGMARTQWTHPSAWPGRGGSASEGWFPGEHGYRLFPSFYRHVFDTMKRTPILGVNLRVAVPTQGPLEHHVTVQVSPEQLGIRPTAFDQLQATHKQVFARRGHFVPLGRDRPRSLEAFRTEYMNLHEGLGFPKRDMVRFFFKLLRYLMTCSERRAAEYEQTSLLAFFDPSLYSEGFLDAIKAAPQALVAMDAERCDARTQGNVYVQLLLDQILGSDHTDSTLRGPTSEAWFAHWYRYLESRNVTFVNAELLALQPSRDPAATPAATPLEVVFRTAPGEPGARLRNAIERAGHIVVALDAISAERVTRSWDSAGVPSELRGFTSHETTDRFQTFFGVQYYFAHDFKLVRGHVYLPDTEWGLSAVSQGQFWPRSSVPDPERVRGILSIDIGNCHRKSSYLGRAIMECTREEIATEVWRQFTDSLRSTRGPTAIVTSLPLPQPISYHVDDNLVFAGDAGRLRSNRSPFLVNNAGDWDRRPRCQPWVPGRPVIVAAPRTDATDVWQAPHGGYRIHAGSVVFCGTYMRTFTRMTTMEAANESARHAVNAILDHIAAHATETDHQPIAGDHCDIWDPEEHELEDLDFFKRIDELLFAAGKPHIADILQFDRIADLRYPDPSPLHALVTALGSTIKSDWGMTSMKLAGGLDGLLQSARQAVGGIAGAAAEHPLLELLGMLVTGKTEPPRRRS